MTKLLAVAFLVAGCGVGNGPSIDAAPVRSGAACISGAALGDPTAINNEVDCPGFKCLHIQDKADRCTATCQVSTDCLIADGAPACASGYSCAPVISSGPGACQKVCVCTDEAPATTCL
ncbi:MAG: hypothetical protein ABI867_02410 [Kofleriaceae bacterium]